MSEPLDDVSRCAICGWKLDPSGRMCVRGDCSMRPFPERFYAPARAKVEYSGALDADSRCRVDRPSLVRTQPERRLKHWSVSVDRDGENLVVIESNSLSGKPEFTEEEAQCVRDCAQQLLAFIGECGRGGYVP